jgi:hypothetical protein
MKGRKTGGRTLATPNKATSSLQDLVEVEAGAPLPVLLTRIGMKAMKAGYHQLAVNALSKAAAYVYPRVASVDPESGSQAAVTISHRWGDGSGPTLYPPLVVDPDGRATIPDNYPGLAIRLSRTIKHMDGTTTTHGPDPT